MESGTEESGSGTPTQATDATGGESAGSETGEGSGKKTRTRVVSTRTLKNYDKAWDAYRQKQTISSVARAASIGWDTAKRLIDEGAPRYNLPPLRDRLATLLEKADRAGGEGLSERQLEALAHTRTLGRTVSQVMTELRGIRMSALISEESLRKIGPEKAVHILERLASVLEKTVKLELLLTGQATSRHEVHSTVDGTVEHVARVRGMQDRELDRLIAQAQPGPSPGQTVDEPDPAVLAWTRSLLAAHEPGCPLLPSGPKPSPAATT